MQDSFVQDPVAVVILGFCVLMSPIFISEVTTLDKEPAEKRKRLAIVLSYALGMLVFGVIGNSIEARRLDMEFVIAFLTMKVTGRWLFRYLLVPSYLLILVSGVGLLRTRRR